MEIRSGWRPLFNTLRAANNSNQYVAILEIFKVFLSTDNTLVFANAALDCILCLLSHIKGLHNEELQNVEAKKKSPTQNKPNIGLKFSKHSKFVPINDDNAENIKVDMCKEALYNLENCADILTIMYNMPKCPIFNTGNRIKGDLPLSVVDPIIPSGTMDITKFVKNDNCEEDLMSYRKLSTSLPPSNTTNNCLLKLDRPSNILKVWYVLIEGLISATVVCSKINQPVAMETLFKLLKNVIEIPGIHFGLHCINHMLLPTVQNWLRQIANINTNWDSVMPNFKQYCGMTTDIIVVYLHHIQHINSERDSNDEKLNEIESELVENLEVSFALKQLMLVLVECIAQPQEPVARLGASCIRHIILTSGHLLTDNQWNIICTSLHRACNVSLTPLRQVAYAFKENSDSFYGDFAIVKVAARRDCTINDNVRLHAMSQQVFYNDQMRNDHSHKLVTKNSSQNLLLIDDRSYVFLIYLQETLNSPNQDMYTIRIPHRGLIIGLLAHQILVQIIATILIQSSSDVFRGINGMLVDNLKSSANVCTYKFYLNRENIDILLKGLELSYTRAIQFDSRPGLKFLVQKVSNLDYAANLYKQTTSSWLIKIIALTDIFFNGIYKFKLKDTDISVILHSYTKSLHLTLEYDGFVSKIFDLKDTWELLCSGYVKQLIHITDFDNDDLKEKKLSCSSLETDSSLNNYNEYYASETDAPEAVIPLNKEDFNEKLEIDENPKPFTFADFKSSTDDTTIPESTIKAIESNSMKSASESFTSTSQEENDDNEKESQEEEATEKQNFVTKTNADMDKQENPSKQEDDIINDTTKCKDNITVCDGPTYNDRINNNGIEPLIPPQPVPPEIEQQRAMSIAKVSITNH